MPSNSLSFERDIKPMFREIDIDHMEPFGVMLADHEWMSDPANAKSVHDYLVGEGVPKMPPDEPWTDEQIKQFADWMAGGYQP